MLGQREPARLEDQDSPGPRGVPVHEVLGEDRSERTAANDDDLERVRSSTGERFIETVADVSAPCTAALVDMSVSLVKLP